MLPFRCISNCKSVPPINCMLTCQLFQATRLYRNFSSYHVTTISKLPMKPGTPIPGLDIYKEKDPIVVLDRSEYPEWVNKLAIPMATLSELRRLPEAEATDKDKQRFLKLTRRIQIKKNSAEMAAQKK